MSTSVKLSLFVILLTAWVAADEEMVCDTREYDKVVKTCREEVAKTHEWTKPSDEPWPPNIQQEVDECKNETEAKFGEHKFCKPGYIVGLGTCLLGKDDVKGKIVEMSGVTEETPLIAIFEMFQECVGAHTKLVKLSELKGTT
ncbi:hypothetical protein ISCGN_028340 [Ixodes scapularis]